MKRYPVAILAGGLATRISQLTKNTPKCLVDFCGKPFIDYQLAKLRESGFEKAVLCVSHLGEIVREYVGDGSRYGMSVTYSFDGDKQMGTGGAIVRALPLLGPKFFIHYGDSYLDCDFEAIQKAYDASGKKGLLTVFRNNNNFDKSNTAISGNMVVKHDKKALNTNSDMAYIDYGTSILSASVFAQFSPQEALDLEEVYKSLVKEHELAAFEVDNRFFEIGSYQGIKDFESFVKEGRL